MSQQRALPTKHPPIALTTAVCEMCAPAAFPSKGKPSVRLMMLCVRHCDLAFVRWMVVSWKLQPFARVSLSASSISNRRMRVHGVNDS